MNTNSHDFLFRPILENEVRGLEGFDPQTFVPNTGNLLVVLPPPVTKIGNIELPDNAHYQVNYGRVAAVPTFDAECPYEQGDVVVFREGTATPIPFAGRKDLCLLAYCDGPESDVLGKIPEKFLTPTEG